MRRIQTSSLPSARPRFKVMAPMNFSLTKNLSFQVLRLVFFFAMALGLIVSGVEIGMDYSRSKKKMDADMEDLARIVLKPASTVVYSFDRVQATEQLKGILSQPAIISAALLQENNELFVKDVRAPVAPANQVLNAFLFGSIRHYVWPLKSPLDQNAPDIGHMRLDLDTSVYGNDFLARSWVTALATVLYALGISGLLFFIFYLQVTKPLNLVINSIVDLGKKGGEFKSVVSPPGHENTEIGSLVRITNHHLDSITSALEKVREAEAKLTAYSDQLELTVAERTQKLQNSLDELEGARSQLIQSEKLAALGGLVAGVAHEVNTPLGVALTATSVLTDAVSELNARFNDKTLTASDFKRHIDQIMDVDRLLSVNLDRAARLIKDFKKTAVDQVSETLCDFDLKETITALISSLGPETRKLAIVPQVSCAEDLKVQGLPGVLSQILTNLIMNSLRHAFAGVETPEITISANCVDKNVVLVYRDNGVGIPEALHKRVFEPFFTTRRGHGGSGLGLNIVYNLVTAKLKGTLGFESRIGHGTQFTITFPIKSAAPAAV